MYWCKIKKAFIQKNNLVVDYNALPHKREKEENGKKKSSKKNQKENNYE